MNIQCMGSCMPYIWYTINFWKECIQPDYSYNKTFRCLTVYTLLVRYMPVLASVLFHVSTAFCRNIIVTH